MGVVVFSGKLYILRMVFKGRRVVILHTCSVGGGQTTGVTTTVTAGLPGGGLVVAAVAVTATLRRDPGDGLAGKVVDRYLFTLELRFLLLDTAAIPPPSSLSSSSSEPPDKSEEKDG